MVNPGDLSSGLPVFLHLTITYTGTDGVTSWSQKHGRDACCQLRTKDMLTCERKCKAELSPPPFFGTWTAQRGQNKTQFILSHWTEAFVCGLLKWIVCSVVDRPECTAGQPGGCPVESVGLAVGGRMRCQCEAPGQATVETRWRVPASPDTALAGVTRHHSLAFSCPSAFLTALASLCSPPGHSLLPGCWCLWPLLVLLPACSSFVSFAGSAFIHGLRPMYECASKDFLLFSLNSFLISPCSHLDGFCLRVLTSTRWLHLPFTPSPSWCRPPVVNWSTCSQNTSVPVPFGIPRAGAQPG
ncbi:uncharacterized protein LOC114033303 [Vombatus ursinus]|uniref:uncharacterized protein LOC114033303 n=1 Tax=Vombatus ursinus TaxID=29139 RepID=UPI000FFD8FB9|nr:uncharacterized protein LOC114033303 [Vombatus ursinus]